MSSKKVDIGSKDLISSLPDELVGHILSFLSTKDAALTSVLSKRWRDLLAFVPNLDFDYSIYDHPNKSILKILLLRRSFKAFVDRVMALQGNAPLNKFSLKCVVGRVQSIVNGWISNVLEHGVVDVDLYIFVSLQYKYPLPPKVLMSKTLARLKLAGTYHFTIDVEEVFLPKLKILHIDKVDFREGGAAFSKLISRCHLLEELVMIRVMWDYWESYSVSNPSLKRLTYCCYYVDENPKSVSFNTPNLVHLEFTDTVAVKYPEVNFDSLVEASLDLRMTPDQLRDARDPINWHSLVDEGEDMIGNASDFLMGVKNVKILCLSSNTLEVLTFGCKAIPVFNNLIHLTIQTSQEVEWDSLPNLLEKCPNLETLVFEGLHYRDTKKCLDKRYRFKDIDKCDEDRDRCVCKPWEGTPICLSSSPVKILKVLKFGGKNDMVKQMDLIKFFLETMPNLEHLILYYDIPVDYDVSTQLQMLEKVASPKCKIQVISDNISFSSTVYSSSSSASELVFFKNTFPV